MAKYYRHMDWLASRDKEKEEVKKERQVEVVKGHVHEDPIYMDKMIEYMQLKPSEFSPRERNKHRHVGCAEKEAKQRVREIIHGKIENSCHWEQAQQLALVVPGYVQYILQAK